MLVDLRRIPELSAINIGPSSIFVGAMARTERLLDAQIGAGCPVLAGAAHNIAHPQIRSRGTVGGSISNADPAAELPAVAILTGARMHVTGPSGTRVVSAEEYFVGLFTTACEWNEILVGVEFPVPVARPGWGFREYARRPGDFAVAGAGVLVTLYEQMFASARIVSFGVGATAKRMVGTESECVGKPVDDQHRAVARRVFEAELKPDESAFASADYKRHVAGAMFEFALNDALHRARAGSP
jgi:carbon-monoxide dehydrogenase medium subunit